MFNLGFSEMVVLAILALIFIGPKQLPEVARMVGRFMNEWRRASDELTHSLTQSVKLPDKEPNALSQSSSRDTSVTGSVSAEVGEHQESTSEKDVRGS